MDNENKKTFLATIEEINKITRQLESAKLTTEKKQTARLRRQQLMTNIKQNPLFNPNEPYFILPLVYPDFKVSSNVALIGNSRLILEKEHGIAIDQHTTVIRFKYAITANYEKYVGTKTTGQICNLRCISFQKQPNHTKDADVDYDLFKKIRNTNLIGYHKGGHHELIRKNRLNNDKYKLNNKMYTISWSGQYFGDVCYFFGTKFVKTPQCGTGFTLLFTDLGIVPDLYGFDLSASKDNYYYYWNAEKQKCTRLSPFHDFDLEYRLLKKLIQEKKIRYNI